MKKRINFLPVLFKKLFKTRFVFADVTTAQTTENGGIVLDHAIRAVYSKEIEYKALPLLLFRQFATTLKCFSYVLIYLTLAFKRKIIVKIKNTTCMLLATKLCFT